MIIKTLAAVLAGEGFDPVEPANRVRAFLIVLLALALIIASLVGVVTAGRRGNNAKALNITTATMLSLIPAAIAVGIGALAFAGGVFDWIWNG
jgi:hypothetical protein